MKTSLMKGRQVSKFDRNLLHSIDLDPQTMQNVWNENMLIGIRDEHGDIYRAIGVTGMTTFIEAITKLNNLGYTYEIATPADSAQGFHAIVSLQPAHS